MDRTSTIILIICAILFIVWAVMAPKVYRRHLERLRAAQQMATQTTTNAQSAQTPTITPQGPQAPGAPVAFPTTYSNTIPEEVIVLSNHLVRYHITSHGGGIKKVELLAYPEKPVVKKGQTFHPVVLNRYGEHLPILATKIGNNESYDIPYQLKAIGNKVVAEASVENGIKIRKVYELKDAYLLQAGIEIEYEGTNTLPALPVWLSTGITGPLTDDTATGPKIMWYDGKKTFTVDEAWFANRFLGCFPGTPRSQYLEPCTNLVWLASNNRFFVIALMPNPPPTMLFCTIQNVTISNHTSHLYPAAVLYQLSNIPPGRTNEIKLTIYAGPKEYRRLSRLGTEFNNELQRVMGFENVLGGRFTAFFAKLLLVCMNGLHDMLKLGYGWIIIIFTFLIKLLFWPLTQASTRSMKRLQELQPQMNAIREKYKDDPEKLNRKMMEFMKEHRVNPMSGCLPILVQMPVFIGFFIMIQSAIELRGAAFLWIRDLSQPDTLFYIPGTSIPFNLLPLLMGATMIWQSHLTPPTPGTDRTQQTILRWMPLIFLVLLYNFPAGLTLYWTVQNLLSIAQMKLTKATQAVPVTTQQPKPISKRR